MLAPAVHHADEFLLREFEEGGGLRHPLPGRRVRAEGLDSGTKGVLPADEDLVAAAEGLPKVPSADVTAGPLLLLTALALLISGTGLAALRRRDLTA